MASVRQRVSAGLRGETVDGPEGLRTYLLSRSDEFVRTVTRKLLEYALGRSLEYYDGPAVRQLMRAAAQNDYRWSSLIVGIVESAPFQMRSVVSKKEESGARTVAGRHRDEQRSPCVAAVARRPCLFPAVVADGVAADRDWTPRRHDCVAASARRG